MVWLVEASFAAHGEHPTASLVQFCHGVLSLDLGLGTAWAWRLSDCSSGSNRTCSKFPAARAHFCDVVYLTYVTTHVITFPVAASTDLRLSPVA